MHRIRCDFTARRLARREFVLSLLVAGQLVGGSAACAQQDNGPASARSVADNILLSPVDPAIAMRVSDSFDYVGRHPIRIRDVAAGERFVFAKGSKEQVDALVVVQFEGFLDGIDDHYRYDLSSSPVVAGYPFRGNPFTFDLSDAVAENPGSESADSDAFLRSRGYSPPDLWMMWRWLTVAGDNRRREMIIFYIENGDLRDLELSDIYRNDANTTFWREYQQGLRERGRKAFELAPLVENSQPAENGWQSLPPP